MPTTASATGATTVPTTVAATTQHSAQQPPLPPSPFPLAEFADRAEVAVGAARTVEGEVASDPYPARATDDLAKLSRDLAARAAQTERMVQSRPSTDVLSAEQADWRRLEDAITDDKRELARRAGKLDGHVQRLSELSELWGRTVAFAAHPAAPPDILRRAEAVLVTLAHARAAAERQRAEVLSLQARASDAGGTAAEALASIKSARDAAVVRLLTRDSPPLWDAAGVAPAAAAQQSLTTQARALRGYFVHNARVFAVHGLLILGLVPAMFWVRNRVRPWAKEDVSLVRAVQVFEVPIAAATLVGLIASAWFYPGAPPLLRVIVGAAALVPTVVILRRLLAQSLYPVLNATVAFYAFDQVRALFAPFALLARLLLLAEMLAGLLFVVWLLRSGRLSAAVGAKVDRLGRAILVGARIGATAFAAAFMAAIVGYVLLAAKVGDATLYANRLALVLYAAVRVADGLLLGALRARPLSLLRAVRENQKLFWQRARRLLHWGAIAMWLALTLENASVRATLLDRAAAMLNARLEVGWFGMSLGQVLAFGLTVWATILLSRFIRFMLDEDVYPRFRLDRGLPYAISTTLHYAILLVGFVMAVGMLGHDMTKFTILAGAFGVGLGFGLQNIFNNFISGLILLFERPVKVGDVIQIGPDAGVVRQIGIRASVIRLADGAEIIMPNGRLISDPVTNWTLSDRRRDVKLAVSVAGQTDPQQVFQIWKKVAGAHPAVVEIPAPRALLAGIGGGALILDLHAWVGEYEEWQDARSDLVVSVNAALAQAGIEVR